MTRWSMPLFLLGTLAFLGACAPEHLTRQEIYDPANCQDCHEDHVADWQLSMHAYAADDPVFLAMDKQRQEETGGALGGFCVGCHAPIAVREEGIQSAEELEDVPEYMKGVTCAFCHLAEEVHPDAELNNNPIELAKGRVLRAAIRDPVRSPAHPAAYGEHLDRSTRKASDLCGSCHDIVLPNGLHLERTHEEWQESLFGQIVAGTDSPVLGCGGCHMGSTERPVADFDGVPVRDFHDHSMPGIDVPLVNADADPVWAERRPAVEALVTEFLKDTVRSEICVNSEPPSWEVVVGLENVSAGHSFPSGSTQDRRVWAWIQAWDEDKLLWETGFVPEDEAASDVDQLILLRNTMVDADGNEAHAFHDADRYLENDENGEPIANPDNKRGLLLGLRQVDGLTVEQVRVWSFKPNFFTAPTRVELRMFERPIGFDVLDELIDEGYLDPAVKADMPTFELTGARLVWEEGQLGTCVTSDNQLDDD